MARSRDIRGPYELHPETHLLTSKDAPDAALQRAGHGQIVETPDGAVYHTHLCSRPLPGTRMSPLGRETAIQKCVWKEDGWLYLEQGGLVPALEVPAPAGARAPEPDAPVEYRFDGPALPDDFQWLRTPYPERLFSLTGGVLRLIGRESVGSLVRPVPRRPPPAAPRLPRRDPARRLRPRHLPAERRPHDLLQPLEVPLPLRHP